MMYSTLTSNVARERSASSVRTCSSAFAGPLRASSAMINSSGRKPRIARLRRPERLQFARAWLGRTIDFEPGDTAGWHAAKIAGLTRCEQRDQCLETRVVADQQQ